MSLAIIAFVIAAIASWLLLSGILSKPETAPEPVGPRNQWGETKEMNALRLSRYCDEIEAIIERDAEIREELEEIRLEFEAQDSELRQELWDLNKERQDIEQKMKLHTMPDFWG